jgi:hypothetical protein
MSRDVYVLGVSSSRHDRAAPRHAAQVIAGDQSVDDGHRLAASLIGGLGTPGAALDVFGTTLLAKPAGAATRRGSA